MPSDRRQIANQIVTQTVAYSNPKITKRLDAFLTPNGETIFRSEKDRFSGDAVELHRLRTGSSWEVSCQAMLQKRSCRASARYYRRMEEGMEAFADGRLLFDGEVDEGRLGCAFGDFSIVSSLDLHKILPNGTFGRKATCEYFLLRREVDFYGRTVGFDVSGILKSGPYPIGQRFFGNACPTLVPGGAGPEHWPGSTIIVAPNLEIAGEVEVRLATSNIQAPVFISRLSDRRWIGTLPFQRVILVQDEFDLTCIFWLSGHTECWVVSPLLIGGSIEATIASGRSLVDYVFQHLINTVEPARLGVLEQTLTHPYCSPKFRTQFVAKVAGSVLNPLLDALECSNILDIEGGTYFMRNGQYWVRDRGREFAISNFTVKVLEDYFIKDDLADHLLQIKVNSADVCSLRMPAKEFDSPRLLWKRLRSEAIRLGLPRLTISGRDHLSRLPAIIDGTQQHPSILKCLKN